MADTVAATQLSTKLDLIIGTEDFIKCQRMRALKLNYMLPEDKVVHYLIGSMCDGLNLETSDADLMFVHQHIPVIDTFCGDETDKTPTSSYLLAYCSPSSSAYMCLEMHIRQNDVSNYIRFFEDLFHSAVYLRDGLLASSSLFLQHSSYIEGGTAVGPSRMISSELQKDQDNVQAFHCKTFPRMANEWIHRKRTYSWPSAHQIQLSKEIGYHLVPIGDYNTTMQHFQWRISFVWQECLLVRTFSHLQMKIYALLKMIKSEILSVYRSQQTSESLITSYHIKTLMFWTIECTPKYMWCKKYFLSCIQICLMFLKRFVKSNYMPHYFMPQCNLFKKHVQKDLKNVVNVLSEYAKNPLTVIALIRPIITFLVPILLNDKRELQVLLTFGELENYSNLNIQCDNLSPNPLTITCVLLTTVYGMSDYEWLLTYGLLLSSISNSQQPIVTHHSDRVRSLYKHHRKQKQKSLRYTHLDISTGWLHLSSYLYEIHNYANSLEITNRKVILPITESPHIFYCGNVRDKWQLISALRVDCSRTSNSQLCKQLVCCHFRLFNKRVIPCELNIEAKLLLDHGLNSEDIPPLTYAYFLSFLCSYHLHDVRLQFSSLQNLQSLLQDKHYGIFLSGLHYGLTLVMVGICYALMGDVSNAAHYYRFAANYNMNPLFNDIRDIRLQLLNNNA